MNGAVHTSMATPRALVSHQIYRDAKECLNLLSKRLGTSQFFFGDT